MEATEGTRRSSTSSSSCLVAKCHERRELGLDALCLTDVADFRSQEARADTVENATAPSVTPPVQSSLTAISTLAVVLGIARLTKQQNAMPGPTLLRPRFPPELAPCHAREKLAESTEPSSGVQRRRKRTKGKKARAAAAKRAARKLDSTRRLEESEERVMAEGAAYNTEGVDSVMHVKHAMSVVQEKATRQGHAQGERSGVPQDDEGQLERSRAECQERADTEPKRTMRLEKPPEEELLPEANRVAKGPALAKVPEELDESSPVIAAAFPLELPSPSKIRRVEENAPADQGMVRCPPLLMQKLWAWIAYRRIGAVVIERAGGCGGGGMSGQGRGQTTASQEEGCAKGPKLVEEEQEAADASPAIGAAIALELPSPRESKWGEEDAAAVASGTGQGGEASPVGVESAGGSRACRLSDGVELLSTVDSLVRTSFPSEVEEELRAKIAGRGGGEVVVESVGQGAVEVVSGHGRGQPEQVAETLVPSMCERRNPGDLKALFVRNLRKVTESGALKGACAVRAAQIALLEDPCGGPCQLDYVNVLGEGGFGTVSAVRHAVLPEEFALKTLREGASQRGRLSAMVEMAVLARLSLVPHPNVIAAVALDDTQLGTMPVLLPKAECDFHTVLTSGGWSLSELLRYVVQVGSGAEHMHDNGFCHGDIKPENILMFGGNDGSLVPQLADFGTTRELGERRPKMMGTVGYMPLECMLESVPTSSSQDVWALAAMTLVICAAPGKVQTNMFSHVDLYTDKERACKDFLQTRGSPSDIADKLRSFECTVTMRTLEDGSYMKMLEKESLNVDLGCRGTVSDCLPYFLAKVPEDRCDVNVFQTVVGNIAGEVAEYEAELEAYWSQSSELLENGDESEGNDRRRVYL